MAMQGNPLVLIPVVVFLAFSIGLALVVRMRAKQSAEGGFISEYFIGSRSLGGFVLAMTTIATYGSVSSFVGGPGQAWSVGFGWVYMAAVQVTALFLLFGIMGKKMALVSRRLNAVTVIDVIRARYKSDAVANVSAAPSCSRRSRATAISSGSRCSASRSSSTRRSAAFGASPSRTRCAAS